jgi:hypothetical protein
VGDVFLALWEPWPRDDGRWSARLIATRASLLQGQCPAFCGRPALGAMGGGLLGLIATRASLLQKYVTPFGIGLGQLRNFFPVIAFVNLSPTEIFSKFNFYILFIGNINIYKNIVTLEFKNLIR